MLSHDAARCTGCRTCAYVCSPNAITFSQADPCFVEWTYFAGQCTFCGRCVEYCPTRCLACEEAVPPVTGDPSAQRVTHRIAYQPCPRCGRPVIPLPLQTLQALYGDPVPEGIAARHGLCERCRGRTAAERLRGMFEGGDHE
jgi:Pyruvate/2-oxoacid:ferredoxin oxidoreductase delta subunit